MRILNADLRYDAVHYKALGAETFEEFQELRIAEGVEASAFRATFAVLQPATRQRSLWTITTTLWSSSVRLRFHLSHRSSDAVWGPLVKLRIVLRVSVYVRDQREALREPQTGSAGRHWRQSVSAPGTYRAPAG